MNLTENIGEELIGINPKLNNLIRSYRAAANDILWVLDSNAAVHPTTLGISIRTLTSSSPSSKRISVVHHVPLATLASSSRRTIGTRLEEAFLNTTHAKMYVALNTLAPDSCVMGKSNIYRRSDVESVDADIAAARRRARNPSASGPSKEDAGPRGLVAFAPFLAEDNMIASALMHSLQTCHSLSHNTVHTSLGSMSLGAYISRRTRWIRVRKRMVLTATLLEPFTESILAGALMSAGLRYLVGTGFWTVWVIHMVAWLCIDLLTCRALDGDGWDQASFVAAWFGREVLTLPIFLWAVFGSEVVWRGQTYKMLWNGYCEIVEKDPNQGASWFGSWFGASRGKGDYRPLPAVRP